MINTSSSYRVVTLHHEIFERTDCGTIITIKNLNKALKKYELDYYCEDQSSCRSTKKIFVKIQHIYENKSVGR